MAGRSQAAGKRDRAPARATDREFVVVAAVLEAGSEKAAAHRLGLSHSTVKDHLASARSKVVATTTAQLVWILAPRLPEPDPVRDSSAEQLAGALVSEAGEPYSTGTGTTPARMSTNATTAPTNPTAIGIP